MVSDGSIHPGIDPVTGEPIDLVTAFQFAADPDPDVRARLALHACPGQGSCGGMFTYNTMQTFIGVLGMEPLHMVSPASDDERRTTVVPGRARRVALHDQRRRYPPARHRHPCFHTQRVRRGDGDGWLHQRRAPRTRDRPRRRVRPVG
jgi:dihydroxyacid dehydratase/phosphogluconate dehydratase